MGKRVSLPSVDEEIARPYVSVADAWHEKQIFHAVSHWLAGDKPQPLELTKWPAGWKEVNEFFRLGGLDYELKTCTDDGEVSCKGFPAHVIKAGLKYVEWVKTQPRRPSSQWYVKFSALATAIEKSQAAAAHVPARRPKRESSGPDL